MDFSWLVVDDGSTDNTVELLEGWKSQNIIPLRYISTKNGGKQRAINIGVRHCTDELFFVVDSDDWLVPDAIEQLTNAWKKVKEDGGVAGIVALRGKDCCTPLGSSMPDIRFVKMWDLYSKYHFRGDTALVYRTEILNDFPFQVADGENFIAESSVYYAIDDFYCLGTLNKILVICQYLPDGLTNNFAAVTKNNPIGYYRHKWDCARRSTSIFGKSRETILYLCGCMLAHKRKAVRDAPHPLLAAVCYLPAIVARVLIFR